jgi:RND family efflux transporter MFP subunit
MSIGDKSSLRAPRSLWPWIGALLILGLLALWLVREPKIAPGLAAAPPPASIDLQTAPVSAVTVPIQRTVVGSVQATVPITAASRVSARVIAVYASAGQRVRHGQLLVKLDSADLAAQVARAQGALAAARAELVRASADRRRFSALLKRGSVTTREYDGAEAAYGSAAGAVAQAQAAVRAARAALDYSTVLAPRDAIVLERMVEPGDLAMPGQPLVRLYDERALRVELDVPEELSSNVYVGTPLVVFVDVGGAPLPMRTQVNEIVPAANAASRTFLVRAPLPPHSGLRPGMFARAGLAQGSQQILTIPRDAVRYVGQVATVQVLFRGALQMRQIALGRPYGAQIEVLAGLNSGERVLIHRNPLGLRQ